ncbi:MAG: glycosyltransferase family protein [Dehalococcoidales bacterium]|nr:glycosyltransferase family protein [Dehalococcoidales bacterium]
MTDSKEGVKVGVFIQVRMKSTRLPRKAMIEIEGKTVIEHLIERVKMARMPNVIVVCTSTHPDDAILIEVAKRAKVNWFAGSEENVMERFLGAAKQERVDIIVRATGDCPLKAPDQIDKAIAHLIANKADYVRLVGMPLGTGCEVFTTKALEKAHSYAIDPNYSEYMSFYFWNNPDVFSMEELECDESLKRPGYRLTVDEAVDIELMEQIYRSLYHGGRIFSLKEVIELLDARPDLVELSKRVKVKWQDDKELVDLLKQKTRLRNK